MALRGVNKGWFAGFTGTTSAGIGATTAAAVTAIAGHSSFVWRHVRLTNAGGPHGLVSLDGGTKFMYFPRRIPGLVAPSVQWDGVFVNDQDVLIKQIGGSDLTEIHVVAWG